MIATGAEAQTAGPDRHLVLEKRIVLQGLSGDLYRILALSVGRDSSFVLLNGEDPFLWLLSPTGQLIRSWGTKGSGPGEFRMPWTLGRRADSIWVWDPGVARLSVFSASGRLARTVPLPGSGQATLLADGQVTVHTMRAYGSNVGDRSRLQVRPVNQARTTLGPPLYEADYSYKTLQYRRGGSTIVGIQPFEDGALFAACADGSGFVYLDRHVSAGGPSKGFGVIRLAPSGKLLYSVRIPYAPVPITSDLMRRAVAELLREGPPDNEPDLEARVRAAIERPAHLPTVSLVLCGTDGSVWLRRENTAGETIRWTILDERGTKTADLSIGRGLSPVSVTRDHAWTVNGDESSIRAIVLWAVR